MKNKIVLTDELVKKIAHLSRIELDVSEISDFRDQLNTVLKYVEVMNEVDTSKIVEDLKTKGSCRLREDTVEPSLSAKNVFGDDSRSESGYFRVDGNLSEPEH